MAADELNPSAGEHRETAVGDAWDELERRTRAESTEGGEPGGEPRRDGESCQGGVDPRHPQGARGPKSMRQPSLSPLRIRLAAAIALFALAAALVRIFLPAVVGDEPATPSAPPPAGRSAHPAATPHGARQAREKRSVRPRAGQGRRRAGRERAVGGAGMKQQRTSRRDGGRGSPRPVHSGPPTSSDPAMPGTTVAPRPESAPQPEEPAPGAPETPRTERGLVDGSHSSAEFGL